MAEKKMSDEPGKTLTRKLEFQKLQEDFTKLADRTLKAEAWVRQETVRANRLKKSLVKAFGKIEKYQRAIRVAQKFINETDSSLGEDAGIEMNQILEEEDI